MSEDAFEKLLIEEQKHAFDYLRFLEKKRDRFVIGSVTASGAVLAFIAQVFSKDGFRLREASPEFIFILILLCFCVSVLSWLLLKAYDSLSPIMKHYEKVVALTRLSIDDEKAKKYIKIENTEKFIIDWLDTRQNDEITQRRETVSGLSKSILSWTCALWLVAGLGLLIFLLASYQLCAA